MSVPHVIAILDFNTEKELEPSLLSYTLVSARWRKSPGVRVILVNYAESPKKVMAKKEKRRVSIYNDVSKDFFESEVIPKREPALLRGLEIGRAREKWTPEYLAENGGERTVKIHVCPSGKMDFIHKNFTYK